MDGYLQKLPGKDDGQDAEPQRRPKLRKFLSIDIYPELRPMELPTSALPLSPTSAWDRFQLSPMDAQRMSLVDGGRPRGNSKAVARCFDDLVDETGALKGAVKFSIQALHDYPLSAIEKFKKTPAYITASATDESSSQISGYQSHSTTKQSDTIGQLSGSAVDIPRTTEKHISDRVLRTPSTPFRNTSTSYHRTLSSQSRIVPRTPAWPPRSSSRSDLAPAMWLSSLAVAKMPTLIHGLEADSLLKPATSSTTNTKKQSNKTHISAISKDSLKVEFSHSSISSKSSRKKSHRTHVSSSKRRSSSHPSNVNTCKKSTTPSASPLSSKRKSRCESLYRKRCEAIVGFSLASNPDMTRQVLTNHQLGSVNDLMKVFILHCITMASNH